jgi:hypothetical protein
MKAVELRLGNILSVKRRNLNLGEVTVSELWIEGNKRYCTVENKYANYSSDDSTVAIKPVPLTEEWLLKFGFEIDSYGWYRLRDTSISRERILSGLYFDSRNQLTISLSEFYIKVSHVHQLQNLYFALTGTELTKIK